MREGSQGTFDSYLPKVRESVHDGYQRCCNPKDRTFSSCAAVSFNVVVLVVIALAVVIAPCRGRVDRSYDSSESCRDGKCAEHVQRRGLVLQASCE